MAVLGPCPSFPNSHPRGIYNYGGYRFSCDYGTLHLVHCSGCIAQSELGCSTAGTGELTICRCRIVPTSKLRRDHPNRMSQSAYAVSVIEKHCNHVLIHWSREIKLAVHWQESRCDRPLADRDLQALRGRRSIPVEHLHRCECFTFPATLIVQHAPHRNLSCSRLHTCIS